MSRAQSVHSPYTTRAYVLAVALGLAGCGALGTTQDGPARAGVTFSPDAEGLAVVETGQRVDFGRAPEGVIAALDRELGPHRAMATAGCPARISERLAWGDLVLTFSEERFVGWKQAGAQAGQVCA